MAATTQSADEPLTHRRKRYIIKGFTVRTESSLTFSRLSRGEGSRSATSCYTAVRRGACSLPRTNRKLAMEREFIDRAENIRHRVLQLRDSL